MVQPSVVGQRVQCASNILGSTRVKDILLQHARRENEQVHRNSNSPPRHSSKVSLLTHAFRNTYLINPSSARGQSFLQAWSED